MVVLDIQPKAHRSLLESQNRRRKSRRLTSSPGRSSLPSKLLLDPLPSPPTTADPRQRIIGKIHRSALTLYLQILASSDYVLSSSTTVSDHVSPETYQKRFQIKPEQTRQLGDRIQPTTERKSAVCLESLLRDERKPSTESLFKKTLALGISQSAWNTLLKRELSLADFRPLKAPFVPYILKVLVNSIEVECSYLGWETVFSPSPQNQIELAELHACLLIQNWNHHHHVKRQVAALPLSLKVSTLRALLLGFKQKPLHFNKKVLGEVIKRPLFDQFLRPNPDIKSLVRHTALPCNRTTMDTLAFLMFHLQHALERGNATIATKTTLAKLYGPLLVSFSERPLITDQDPTDYKTEEAAIMEVVLEVCNLQFWDNLSMLQMHLAFEDGSATERESYEDITMKTPQEPSEYEEEAWFDSLFEFDWCAFHAARVGEPQQPSIMPWNTQADCRIKPPVVAPAQETALERIERAKREVGEALGGRLQAWCPPAYLQGPPQRLRSGELVHNVFLHKQLRDTPSILRDVMWKARLPSASQTSLASRLASVPPRVCTRLSVPSEKPQPNAASFMANHEQEI